MRDDGCRSPRLPLLAVAPVNRTRGKVSPDQGKNQKHKASFTCLFHVNATGSRNTCDAVKTAFFLYLDAPSSNICPFWCCFHPPVAHSVVRHSHWSDGCSPNASLPLPLPSPVCSSSLLGSWSVRSCRAVPVHSFRTKCVCDSVSTFAILARVNFDSVSLPSAHDLFSLRHSWVVVVVFFFYCPYGNSQHARRGLFSGSLLSPPRCLCAFSSLFAFSFCFILYPTNRQRVDAHKYLCIFQLQKQIAAHCSIPV